LKANNSRGAYVIPFALGLLANFGLEKIKKIFGSSKIKNALEFCDHFGFHFWQQFFNFFLSLFFKNMQKCYHFEIPDENESF
jgi:hypothetical protein